MNFSHLFRLPLTTDIFRKIYSHTIRSLKVSLSTCQFPKKFVLSQECTKQCGIFNRSHREPYQRNYCAFGISMEPHRGQICRYKSNLAGGNNLERIYIVKYVCRSTQWSIVLPNLNQIAVFVALIYYLVVISYTYLEQIKRRLFQRSLARL